MYIYLIVNHVTGRYYVGQHKGGNLRQYFQQKCWEAEHELSPRSRLYAAIRENGRDNFTIHALLSDVQTRLELNQHEREFITFLRAQDPEYGYNIGRGGEGFTGHHTLDARKRMSASHKALRTTTPMTPSQLANLKPHRLGYKASPETCRKIAKALKGQDRLGKKRDEAICRECKTELNETKDNFGVCVVNGRRYYRHLCRKCFNHRRRQKLTEIRFPLVESP